jgi:hypothetical protein
MMHRYSLILLILLFASCHQQKEVVQNDCCKSQLKKKFENYSSKKLGKEYQRMKNTTDKCCEKFGSDLQKLMQALSEKVGKTGSDSCCVTHIMGIPDATEVPKQYGVFNTGNEKIMIYWWRSWHDFLYFITEDGMVKQVKWFNAYE